MKKLTLSLVFFLITLTSLGNQIVFNFTNDLIEIFSFSETIKGNLEYDPYRSKITIKFESNILEFFENREFFIINSNFVVPMPGGLLKSNYNYYLRLSSIDSIVSLLKIECRILNFQTDSKFTNTNNFNKTENYKKDSTKFYELKITNETSSSFTPIKFVIIDPGHGGKDPGAIHNGIKEKDLTLKYGKKVFSELSKKLSKMGIKVVLTRETDIYLTLEQRAKIANDLLNKTKGYGIFISIHKNASPVRTKKGMEIYYVSEQGVDDSTREVLVLENSFIPKEEIRKISDLEKVIGKIRSVALMEESKILSKIVSKNFGEHITVKGAPFYVIKYIPVPSILVEVGYISNPEEAKLLNSDSYINSFSEKLSNGILEFIAEYNKTKGFTLATPLQ